MLEVAASALPRTVDDHVMAALIAAYQSVAHHHVRIRILQHQLVERLGHGL